jgi:hypothetical protein
VTVYRIPPPVRSGPAVPSSLGVERWACGVCASWEQWPADRFTFQLPDIGRPVFVEHREEMFVSSGMAAASVGTARRFAQVDGLVIVLLEITEPSVLWDLAEGKRNGLSIKAHMDPPPTGGADWTYIAEVSLTARPKDPLARVVSTGQVALDDWLSLTGEAVPA